MRFSLNGKNKLSFVEGLDPTPNEPDLLEKWNRCNSVIMSCLLNSVDKSIYSSLVYYSKAYDVWHDLKLTYSKRDETRLYSIVQEISRISQGNDSVSVYYVKLKMLWDQYADVKFGTKCTCAVYEINISDENNLKLMQFLMGLNDKYAVVRSNILMISPLPSVITAFNLVSQEESHRSLSSKHVSDKSSAVFVANKTFKKFKAKNLNLKCSHYGG